MQAPLLSALLRTGLLRPHVLRASLRSSTGVLVHDVAATF
jgi:hypothetical protein